MKKEKINFPVINYVFLEEEFPPMIKQLRSLETLLSYKGLDNNGRSSWLSTRAYAQPEENENFDSSSSLQQYFCYQSEHH